MSKNQYTITERNFHEQETFGYVMNLTDVEAELVKEKIETVDYFGRKPLSIAESN